ncbi:oxidoreductase [Actinomadura craniellae]|uniref:Probable oxidoreductase n=1 Tax=Actinomadura craniellae TaxID=2231787 RepID=A0A365H314_9ACTN|nr:oxidoreductase [Actinomadura craniellae]RAY13495.1 oxidoreductase [Actinomadura craniellae]
MTTSQQPLGSGFGAAATAADVIEGIDLSGKVAIVTGGYSGLGLETTRALRSAGAEVVVPVRDREKATAALKGLDGVEIEALDLIAPASVDAFAERFLASGRPLHILVNNAGIMASPLARDARGYEAQFATNHLGHFQLTARLWPALRRAGGARVVSVSSRGHRLSPVVFDDIDFERREYERWSAYGQAKTANVLFAVALDERGRSAGVRAFSLHPGTIADTDLKRHLSAEDLQATGAFDEAGNVITDPERDLKTVEQGAATNVWCATSPRLDGLGGVYCENSDIARPMSPGENGFDVTLKGVASHALDPDAADRLWDLSERRTGTTLG